MRYLVEAFAVGALRRGAEIEQFLGMKEHNGERGVAWVEIWPREQGYVITLYGGMDRADGYRSSSRMMTTRTCPSANSGLPPSRWRRSSWQSR
ncbi:hypothetical protein ACWCYL_20800 [Streptomyces sp. 900105755]